MHMVAARLGCERAMVGTSWATPRPECMVKSPWALNRCLTTESADYYMSGHGRVHESAY